MHASKIEILVLAVVRADHKTLISHWNFPLHVYSMLLGAHRIVHMVIDFIQNIQRARGIWWVWLKWTNWEPGKEFKRRLKRLSSLPWKLQQCPDMMEPKYKA